MQTYPNTEYKKFAEIIHDSLKYGIGDNFPRLKSILFLMKNNDDLTKLILAYGFRYNYLYGLPYGKKQNLLNNLRLQLRDKANGYYSKELNEIRKDWETKKIKYRI